MGRADEATGRGRDRRLDGRLPRGEHRTSEPAWLDFEIFAICRFYIEAMAIEYQSNEIQIHLS
ncbi:MAG UNVERIFIED_CONTAM: hypothetical protein MIO30_19840 [Methylobacterium ajmalii]|jgi:hypothetical protein|uniref:hypothetical protein n=1 Tax=Methylobacterium ajmalii TaxID=2738439 RepID=UPI00190B58D1|nr:hypothetical protein [Methylobacterium ajmalii]MBK3420478.1 hypothetical protein [Methylobacterium ajmalii]MBZ6414227.1 hypothetical protein [Methylobacterium sp.]